MDPQAPPADAPAAQIHDALAAFIESDRFACVGAKNALARETVTHHHYAMLGTRAVLKCMSWRISTHL